MLVLEFPRADGLVDEERDGLESSSAWAASLIASSVEEETRLEAVRRWGGSADDACVGSLWDLAGEGYQRGCQREGRGLGGERGAQAHRRHCNRRRMAAVLEIFSERFRRGWSKNWRESKGG
jgi:hypothetical protein